VAVPSGDHIPLGGFVLKTGFDADAAAELKWATILVGRLALFGRYLFRAARSPENGLGSSLAST
jgi:hypothetical protein